MEEVEEKIKIRTGHMGAEKCTMIMRKELNTVLQKKRRRTGIRYVRSESL